MTRRSLALALLLIACQAAPSAGTQCTRASDCAAPLVCAIGRCRAACTDSRDCPTLARCLVEPSTGTRVCSLASTDDCTTHGCALGFACVSGACLNACGAVVRCPDGVCTDGACVPTRMPVDAGPSDAGAIEGGASTTWTIALVDADDGELGPDSVLFDGEPNETDYAGFWSSGNTWSFARFALPGAIPPGARVLDARLRVNGLGSAGLVSEAEHLAVVADDTADAPATTDPGDYPGGLRGTVATTASVAWGPLTDWAIGPGRSPDLSPILQELVDHHGGLAAGAHVRLWIAAGDYMAEGEVGWQDTMGGAGGPELELTWAPP